MSNKRPDYDEEYDSPEEIKDVNEREQRETRAKNTRPKVSAKLRRVVDRKRGGRQ
jgi:hypothetical protein